MLHKDSYIRCRIMVLHICTAEQPLSVLLNSGPRGLEERIIYQGGGGNKPQTIMLQAFNFPKKGFNFLCLIATSVFPSLTLFACLELRAHIKHQKFHIQRSDISLTTDTLQHRLINTTVKHLACTKDRLNAD